METSRAEARPHATRREAAGEEEEWPAEKEERGPSGKLLHQSVLKYFLGKNANFQMGPMYCLFDSEPLEPPGGQDWGDEDDWDAQEEEEADEGDEEDEKEVEKEGHNNMEKRDLKKDSEWKRGFLEDKEKKLAEKQGAKAKERMRLTEKNDDGGEVCSEDKRGEGASAGAAKAERMEKVRWKTPKW